MRARALLACLVLLLPSVLAEPDNLVVDASPGGQSETTAALDPTNPQHLVVGAFDAAARACAAYASQDGGATWIKTLLPGTPTGDPVAVFSREGVAYFTCINAFFRSADGGLTWIPERAPFGGGSEDKPWIAVDESGGAHEGRVYRSWTGFSNRNVAGTTLTTTTIEVAYTDDGGAHWSAAVAASPSRTSPWLRAALPLPVVGSVQMSQVAVGPDGSVDVVYRDNELGALEIARSLDGGASFGPPATVAPFKAVDGSRGAARYATIPSLAVTGSGTLYVAWADAGRDAGDVLVTTSADGATWTTPARANDDASGNLQVMPALSAAPNGRVSLTFYDSRDDPGGALWNVYEANVTDGLAQANARVTTAPSNASVGTLGDYMGLASTDAATLAAWTDARSGSPGSGNTDVYAAFVPG